MECFLTPPHFCQITHLASACMPAEGCTKCDVWWLQPLLEICLQCGTHLSHNSLYCLRRVAPSLRGCIVVRSQYFYGWKEKILHWKMYSWNKAFCTPFFMSEIRLKKIETLRKFPFSCKFALFRLLYFVCTHSITTKYYIKNMNMNNKLWSVYDG